VGRGGGRAKFGWPACPARSWCACTSSEREREVEPFGGDHREREDEWDKLSVHKKTGEGASSAGSSDHGLRAWARYRRGQR